MILNKKKERISRQIEFTLILGNDQRYSLHLELRRFDTYSLSLYYSGQKYQITYETSEYLTEVL